MPQSKDRWEQYAAKPEEKSSGDKWDRFAVAAPEAEKLPSPTDTISATPQPKGVAGKSEAFLEKQIQDIQRRARGGTSEGAASFMESLPVGILQILKGITEAAQSGKRWQGAKDTASGALNAATMPSMVFAPEGTEAAGKLLPSKDAAGAIFNEVEKVAGKVPIDVNIPGKVALKMHQLNDIAGHYLPAPVRKFLTRVTKPGAPPLTFSEARDIYSAVSRLSANEESRVAPVIKYQLGNFKKALGDVLYDAAESVGAGKQYNEAMRKYRTAAKFSDFKDAATKNLASRAAKGVGAYWLYDQLHK
jgi:hypothetical protein